MGRVWQAPRALLAAIVFLAIGIGVTANDAARANVLYGVLNSTSLVRIDLTDGSMQQVGTGFGQNRQTQGLAFAPDGRLIGADSASDRLYELDPVLGTLGDVIPNSQHSVGANAMEIDANGMVWMAWRNRSGPHIETQPLSNPADQNDYSILGMPTSYGIRGLTFDAAGLLYAIATTSNSARLYTIDTDSISGNSITASFLAEITASTEWGALEFGPDGALYGTSIAANDRSLYRIGLDGVAVRIGQADGLGGSILALELAGTGETVPQGPMALLLALAGAITGMRRLR